MNTPAIYIVGPMSGRDANAVYEDFHNRAKRLRDMGYSVINPFACKEHLLGTGTLENKGYTDPLSNDHAVFHRDKWMCHQADIIYADFTHCDKPSIGSCFELAWACQAGKKIITVLPPRAYERHPMDHLFIHNASTLVYPDVDKAEGYLREFRRSLTG